MTSIVSFRSQRVVQVAADRLLSVSRRGKIEAHDPDSNKLAVLAGPNCRAVFGYSGIAHLNGRPTDEIIAKALSGVDDFGSKTAMMVRSHPLPIDLPSATKRLRVALGKAFGGIDPALAPVVLAAGWHLRTKAGMPRETHTFSWRLRRRTTSGPFELVRIPKGGGLHVHGVPDGRLQERDVNVFFDRVQAAQHDVPDTEAGLVALVRTVSERADARGDPTVGRDVMVVSIENPTQGNTVRIRYESDLGSSSRFGGFAPWIVTTYNIWPPTEITSGRGVVLDGVAFEIIGPPDRPDHIGISAQKRRGPPR